MTAESPAAIADRVLDMVGGRGEAEVAVSAGRSALTRFADSFIHQNVAEDDVGIRLRLVADGRLAAASTSRGDEPGLRQLVEGALDAARLRPPDPGWPGLAPPAPAPDLGRHDAATHRATPERRALVVREFVDAGPGGGAGSRLTAAGYCSTGGHEAAFANSAGQRLAGRSSRAVVDAIHRTPTSDGSGWQVSSVLADIDGGAAGARAAAKARAGADPVELGPGEYEVVLEPACVADMVDFLVGLGFSAKVHAEGRSFVRLGEAQFDPAISLFDDAGDPRTVGLAFDAEGTPKRRLDLVRAGVSSSLLHDRRTARAAGAESTGHAVGGGESFGPGAGNLFLAPGPASLEELVGRVERGILVTEFWYTRVLDPKTQVVTGLTRNGTFLIEGGEVTGGIRNLRFTQSYARALEPGNVLGVGSDARLHPGGAHVPSLHLATWNFTS